MPHPIFGNQYRAARMYRYVARFYDRLRPLFTGFAPTRKQYFSKLPLADDDRILDVGCGTGESMRRVAGGDREVHGVDLSPHQLRYATEKPSLQDATVTLGDAVRLPYQRDTFDVVMSIGSLPYVSDVDAALADAHRVTRPGGRLFVVGPRYPTNPIARRVADGLVHFLEPEAFTERCRAAGWSDIETETVHMDWLARDALVVTARA
ncbi:SAM-dependent methyltransferase [Halanaeroarchaeum sp. HSR-CO]|uniref:class I SAM-dependent methyltransferase n=1 Tax=Halanaeroarchaeum sp. HSR-CO TaxID=2866382 RepID=UPI00217CDDA9|nr:class I SAM-dependent methyltransferase [Halanaeroarchaeum sp. HSR-CO]UWG48355.1 SAM-dependent methyltransferase [Halanaeroarchaeum sp. HSR-CO]